jgi:signal transduction histidine kinase
MTRASAVGRWAYPVVAAVLAMLGATQLLIAPDERLVVSLPTMALGAVGVSLLRRALPIGMGLILASALIVQFAVGTPPFALFVATMAGVYATARYGDRRTVLVGFGALLLTVAALAASQIAAGTDGPFGVVIILVYWAVVAGAGWATRQRAAYTRLLSERAVALEREREHLAELAAAAERARLAREVHDVVSHGVSLLVLQAEAAREVLDRRPEQAALALDAMADTGRRTVADLRQMLGLLRHQGAEPAVDGDLAALIGPVRLAALAVELVECGTPAEVPAALRPTVYRLVQEALTNVVKHAGAQSVTVALSHSATAVTVEVTDDGRAGVPGRDGRSVGGPGRGLVGMAERVSELGGTLVAGPCRQGGFRVRVELPRSAVPGIRQVTGAARMPGVAG